MADWRMVEWQNGRMAEWQNVGMAEWQNGGMAECLAKWQDGQICYIFTKIMVRADDDTNTF
jgi:hypothetical protein